MKKIITLLGLFALSLTIHAQGLGAWFSQHTTQLEYLIKQIALLKEHVSGIQKGYRIAKDGLHVISDLKNGEFNLHRSHFDSLKTVSATVKKYKRIGAIILLEKSTLKYCNNFKNQLQNNKGLQSPELNYAVAVSDKIIENCIELLDALTQLVTDNQFAMDDVGRMERIDLLYEQAIRNYRFANGLGNKARFVIDNRERELINLHQSRKLNGLNY